MTIRYLVQPPSAKNPVLFLTVSHILQCYSQISIMDRIEQQDFFVVCMVIWLIGFHFPFKKKGRAEGKGSKASNFEYNIRYRIMCVFFKGFYL